MDDVFRTIQNKSEGLYKDKGSKFIALAFPIETEQSIKQCLADTRKAYHDARHHCYAYAIGKDHDHYRINDDGEPSGTAGKPIYGQIQSYNLTNILIIVVRYFGGTKLGVRGLINAYKAAAKDAIDNNIIIEKHITKRYRVDFEYAEMNNVMRILKDMELPQENHNFSETCSLEFSVRQSLAQVVFDAFTSIEKAKITPI
ncbi:MAG: YigZ family protein [Bacteroidetes bacterium]|nr:YigZ family protein [Bacteroidota bacterium]